MKKSLVVGIAFAAVTAVAGELRTWCGPAGTQDWSDSANWKDGLVADGDDRAYFPQNNAYHPNGTGQRRCAFKVTPPVSFTGTILTTNEFAAADYSASNLNMCFRPIVELEVLDGAVWMVAGDGEVVATEGIGARLSPSFTGTLDVRCGTTFTVPAGLNGSVSLVGAGTLVLATAGQVAQAEAFAGTVRMPTGVDASVASLTTLRNATVALADGQVFSVQTKTAALNAVGEIESFADAPEKWTFNGTAGAEGNIPSGPFNPDPPYVKDGELWLTDEPAQVHTVWYAARRFRLTDDWGMRFTYWPELPKGTRITDEKRADGKGRPQSLCGDFGILFSRRSTDNCGVWTTSSAPMPTDARGFALSLYRDDGGARACWISEGNVSSYRSMNESCMNGVKLNQPIDFTVSMIRGTMTVTMVQGTNSVTFVRDYSIVDSRAPEGCFVGFCGTTSWWGDDNAVPWVRHRISGFSAWYRDPTDGPGWEEIPTASSFDITDASKWNYKKLRRENDADTDLSSQEFTADGVKLLDSVPDNTAYAISKAKVGKWDTPIAYRFKFKTANQYFSSDAHSYITFLFGDNNTSTQSNGANWQGSYYLSNFSNWTRGLDFVWDTGYGNGTIERSKWGGDSVPNSVTPCLTGSGVVGNTYVSATIPPEKNLRADFIYDGVGSLKAICEISLQDHTLSRPTSSKGNGKIGVLDWAAMGTTTGFDVFTNKEQYVGFKAMERTTSYADLTMTELSIRRLTSAQCGVMGAMSVPADATATLKAGEAMSGQTADVMKVSSLDLAMGSTLTVMPEKTATSIALGSLVSGGATLVAGEGSSVRLGSALKLTGSAEDAGLVLSGATVAPSQLAVTIPSSWRKYRQGPLTLVDATDASGFSIDPANVRVLDENGEIPSEKFTLKFANGCLTADFCRGMMILLR